MKISDFYLTKEHILSITTQEKIFTKYLYTPNTKGSFVNPFRKDTTAGCTFYYKNSILYFVDWAWEKKHYNCFDVVMTHYNCSLSQAFKHIKEDVDVGDIEKITREEVITREEKKSLLQIKRRDYSPHELAFWNIGGMEITQEFLESNRIYCVETIWEQDWIIDNCKFTFAYLNQQNQITQIYIPKNKKTERRRFINKQGFILGNLDRLPLVSDYVLISKSRKCSFYLELFGITNIYSVNESSIIRKDVYNYLKATYHNIFFLGDNDFAGKRLAVKYRWAYPDVTTLLFPAGEPKDFTDTLSTYGKKYIIDLIVSMKDKFLDKDESDL